MINNFTPIKHLYFWCQKIIPLVYDNSLSYYELLDKVVEYINNIIKDVNALGTQVNINMQDIAELKTEVEMLQTELEKVKNGDYVSLYINALSSWIDKNLQELVGRVVKYVFFGLTDDGYFVAYIPDSWDWIEFDTIIQPENPLYGHLLLRW